MIEIQLQWPPVVLSPNARTHWATLSREKKKYRNLCGILTLDQVGINVKFNKDMPYWLDLEFVRPDRRKYDCDNLMARMKSGIDGMCDALLIDDNRFSRVTSSISQTAVGGWVLVKIDQIGVSDDGN